MIRYIATCLLLVSSSISFANDDNWYVGGMLGQSEIDTGVTSSTLTTIDDTDTAFQGILGYSFSDTFSLEGHYGNLGEASLVTQNGGSFTTSDGTVTNNTGVALTVTLEGTTMGLGGVLHGSKENDFVPFVKGGWHSWDAKATASAAGVNLVSVDDDGTDFFYGVGLMWRVAEGISVRGEYTSFKFDDDDVTFAGLGVVFGF